MCVHSVDENVFIEFCVYKFRIRFAIVCTHNLLDVYNCHSEFSEN